MAKQKVSKSVTTDVNQSEKFHPPSMVKYYKKHLVDQEYNWNKNTQQYEQINWIIEPTNTSISRFKFHLTESLISHFQKDENTLVLENIPSHQRVDLMLYKSEIFPYGTPFNKDIYYSQILFHSYSINNLIGSGLLQIFNTDSLSHRIPEIDAINKDIEFYKLEVLKEKLKNALLNDIKNHINIFKIIFCKTPSSPFKAYDSGHEYSSFVLSIWAVTDTLPVKSTPFMDMNTSNDNISITEKFFHSLDYKSETIEKFTKYLNEKHNFQGIISKTNKKTIEKERD